MSPYRKQADMPKEEQTKKRVWPWSTITFWALLGVLSIDAAIVVGAWPLSRSGLAGILGCHGAAIALWRVLALIDAQSSPPRYP